MNDNPRIEQINIDKVLRQRLDKRYRFIPKFIIKWFEKTICQEQLNELLINNGDRSGVDFCEGVINDLNVSYKTYGSLPSDNKRVIIVSNHPLGGLDGMILADMVSKQYGGIKDIKFVVNDLLTYITPLRSIFYGVNKHGSQSRETAARLDAAFASDAPVIMFPAGMCSRKGDDGSIRDLNWHKMVVAKAISSGRDIIPVYFDGENSQFFYKFARRRAKLGLKFNVEMIYLPREVFKNRGRSFNIVIGKPISRKSLKGGKDAQKEADMLRETVYSLRSDSFDTISGLND